MNRTNLIVWIASLTVGLAACGGGDEPPPEDDTSGSEVVAPEPEPEPEPVAAPAPSPVRVIHAAAGVAAATISGQAGSADEPAAEFTDVAYMAPSAYTEVAPAAGATSATFSFAAGEATAEVSSELTSGIPHTIVVYSDPDDMAGLAAVAVADEAQTVTGQQRGRLVNALHGAASIDLCLPGASRREAGRPIFMDVAYGQVGGIPSFPSFYQPITLAGVTQVQVRTHADTPCSGALIGVATMPPVDHDAAHNLTMIAIGRAGTARPRVPRQLLICQDAPGTGACVPIPLAAR